MRARVGSPFLTVHVGELDGRRRWVMAAGPATGIGQVDGERIWATGECGRVVVASGAAMDRRVSPSQERPVTSAIVTTAEELDHLASKARRHRSGVAGIVSMPFTLVAARSCANRPVRPTRTR
jgi:hypothetical protein